MGKFGKCCCEPVCCLTLAELQTRFTNVVISGPTTPKTVSFTADGKPCCNTATTVLVAPTPVRACKYLFEKSSELAVTVQQKILKSKKATGGTYRELVPPSTLTGCPVDISIGDQSAASMCDDVRDCGKTRFYSKISYSTNLVVDYSIEEVRVDIFEAAVSCDNEPSVCKLVVQVSQLLKVLTGVGTGKYEQRTTTHTGQSPCCERTPSGAAQGSDEYDYHPACDLPDILINEPFDCDDDAQIVFAPAPSYIWNSRFKFYDSLADVPTTITVTDADTTDCVFDVCTEGDAVCVGSNATPGGFFPPFELRTIGYMKNCQFCFDYGFECDDCLMRLATVDFTCYADNLWRWEGRNASWKSFTEDGIMDTYRTIDGGAINNLWASTCFRLKFPDVAECGFGASEEDIAADTNGCFWWDCVDCVLSGADPFLGPYQRHIHDVTELLQNNEIDYGEGPQEICIPFVSTTLQLGGPATGGPA
jgi:hypothetical protein